MCGKMRRSTGRLVIPGAFKSSLDYCARLNLSDHFFSAWVTEANNIF
jgi:hypothetical protein